MISGRLINQSVWKKFQGCQAEPAARRKKAAEQALISLKLAAEIVMEVIASDWIQ